MKLLSYVEMCGSERNHYCGLIFVMFIFIFLVQRGTIVVALNWWCFRFIKEPKTSVGVGGWDEYFMCIFCWIHASCISEIGVRTSIQWRVSSSERGSVTSLGLWSNDEIQVQRGDLGWVFVHIGTRFREEPMMGGLISNIILTSKILVPHALKLRRWIHFIHKHICWLIIVVNDLCDWWMVLLNYSCFFMHH